MNILWNILSFLPNMNFIDYLLVGILGLLSLVLIGAGIFAFVKDKPFKTIILSIMGGISLLFAFIFSKHSNKQSKELEKKILELKKKEMELMKKISELDKEAKEGYEEYKRLLKEKEKIEKELNEKLKENEKIKPKPVETSEDVLNAFDDAANISKDRKKKG